MSVGKPLRCCFVVFLTVLKARMYIAKLISISVCGTVEIR